MQMGHPERPRSVCRGEGQWGGVRRAAKDELREPGRGQARLGLECQLKMFRSHPEGPWNPER